MNESDELYRNGISHYAKALFAAGHFESVIVQAVSRIMDENKTSRLAGVFGIENLQGGGILRTRPSVEEMYNMSVSGFWAWIGLEFWIPHPNSSNCFVGLCISEGKPTASVMFRNNNLKFRERLKKILPLTDVQHRYDKDSRETVFFRSLDNSDLLVNFDATLDGIVNVLLAALIRDSSFQTPSIQE